MRWPEPPLAAPQSPRLQSASGTSMRRISRRAARTPCWKHTGRLGLVGLTPAHRVQVRPVASSVYPPIAGNGVEDELNPPFHGAAGAKIPRRP